MFTSLLIVLMSQQGGTVPATPAPELRVVVIAPVYHPDGAVTGETTTIGAASPTVLYVFSRRSLCDTASATATEPRDAGFGWRVASHVVRAAESQMVVSVDWRREWDRGQKVSNGPAGAAQLTLSLGDRIPLDHIPNTLPNDACRAVGMGLEVRLGRAASLIRPGDVAIPTGTRQGGTGSLDVDLWLVHTTPFGSQQAQHQTVRLTAAGGMFTFAPVKFETTRGEIGVELTGSFQRFSASAGAEFLLVSMSRLITGSSASPAGVGGTTSSLIALPKPDEVVSFDMAAATSGFGGGAGGRGRGGGGGGARSSGGMVGSGVRGTGETGAAGPQARGGPTTAGARGNTLPSVALLDGHRFSLRVKVTPVPGS